MLALGIHDTRIYETNQNTPSLLIYLFLLGFGILLSTNSFIHTYCAWKLKSKELCRVVSRTVTYPFQRTTGLDEFDPLAI